MGLIESLSYFVEEELDQWECWWFDTTHGPVYVSITRELSEEDREENYELVGKQSPLTPLSSRPPNRTLEESTAWWDEGVQRAKDRRSREETCECGRGPCTKETSQGDPMCEECYERWSCYSDEDIY